MSILKQNQNQNTTHPKYTELINFKEKCIVRPKIFHVSLQTKRRRVFSANPPASYVANCWETPDRTFIISCSGKYHYSKCEQRIIFFSIGFVRLAIITLITLRFRNLFMPCRNGIYTNQVPNDAHKFTFPSAHQT